MHSKKFSPMLALNSSFLPLLTTWRIPQSTITKKHCAYNKNYFWYEHNTNFASTNLPQNEVRQQILVTTIRSYLKLYSTISTSKLSNLLRTEEQEADENEIRTYLIPPPPPLHFFDLRRILLCYKHKTRNLLWTGGSPLTGKFSSSSDVDFYVDKGNFRCFVVFT